MPSADSQYDHEDSAAYTAQVHRMFAEMCVVHSNGVTVGE